MGISGIKIPTLDNALLLGLVLETPVESFFAERAAELRRRIETHREKKPAA